MLPSLRFVADMLSRINNLREEQPARCATRRCVCPLCPSSLDAAPCRVVVCRSVDHHVPRHVHRVRGVPLACAAEADLRRRAWHFLTTRAARLVAPTIVRSSTCDPHISFHRSLLPLQRGAYPSCTSTCGDGAVATRSCSGACCSGGTATLMRVLIAEKQRCLVSYSARAHAVWSPRASALPPSRTFFCRPCSRTAVPVHPWHCSRTATGRA